MERIVKAAGRRIEGMVLGGEPRRRSAGVEMVVEVRVGPCRVVVWGLAG
jgi:hypothetical protein